MSNMRLMHVEFICVKSEKTEHFKVTFSPSEKHVLFFTDVDR